MGGPISVQQTSPADTHVTYNTIHVKVEIVELNAIGVTSAGIYRNDFISYLSRFLLNYGLN